MVQALLRLLRLVIQMRALFEKHLLGWLIEEISRPGAWEPIVEQGKEISVPNWAEAVVEAVVEVISEQSLAKPRAMPKAKKS